MNQLHSSTASAPSTPAASDIFYATHITSSSVNQRVTILGTPSYSSKAAHADFSKGGTCMSGGFSCMTSVTSCPFLVKRYIGKRPSPLHPPLPVAQITIYQRFPDINILWNLRAKASSSPYPYPAYLTFLEAPSASAYHTRKA